MKSMDTFSFKTSPELEEGKWMLCLTSLEVFNSIFKMTNITTINKTILNITPGFWKDPRNNKNTR